ncbi:MAG: superoxide dismutase [Pseudomonadota bacterium]
MFTLPDLPYAYDALAPVISDRTLHFHHDKHHATYVKTLNELLDAAGKASASLEEVIIASSKAGEAKLYNNAAQAWNHAFFWVAMTPEAKKPEGDLAAAIEASFGGMPKLREAFVAGGAAHFGSGWLWLVAGAGKALEVRALHDAKDTVTDPDVTPLLVCDLWEHAYYLDYQNDRKAFLEAWFDALPNWPFAASQFKAASGGGEAWRHPAPSGDEASARAA